MQGPPLGFGIAEARSCSCQPTLEVCYIDTALSTEFRVEEPIRSPEDFASHTTSAVLLR